MLLQRVGAGFSGASRHRSLHRARGDPTLYAVQNHQPETHAQSKLTQASKDLQPYMLWDRVMKLQAWWDTRSQADFQEICGILEPRALDKIKIHKAEDMEGQPLTCLTIVCKPDDGDDVAAALLQWTPATHVTATRSEQCYLPQYVLPVSTAFGEIDVQLSLAGSSVRKITPNWPQCQAAADAAAAVAAQGPGSKESAAATEASEFREPAAAAAAAGSRNLSDQGFGLSDLKDETVLRPVNAAAVAAAAAEQLSRGLQDGTVKLDAHLLL